jgi:hypothetical protein
MRTIHAVIRNRRQLKPSRGLVVLLIAVALVAIDVRPSRIAASGAATQPTVALQTATVPMLTGNFQVVNNGPGNQYNPHVDCNLVSYTNDDFMGTSTIHYFDLSTNTDKVVPGNGVDLLSDVSGGLIAFTEVDFPGDGVFVFDTASQTRTAIPGRGRSNPRLGGNLVAFEDRSTLIYPNQSEIGVYDLNTGSVAQLTNDALFDKNPAVSPTGNAVVWEKCQTEFSGCVIYSAIQTGPGTFQTQLLAGVGENHMPHTNGQIAVYISNKSGENDIYYQPVGGGAETHLSIPGDQRDVSISGNLIAFESNAGGAGYDIYVYDISTAKLYQVTNTPGYDETLSEISVCNGIGRIVYAIVGNDFDVWAFTFQVPNSTETQIGGLMAMVRSFNLSDGIENSLITKLQDALAAISASDTATACDSLSAFISEAQALSGKKLTAAQAFQLINSAGQIKAGLGCQ